MADRGRDLKFSILSDVDKFDTDKPAKGLENLADAADAAESKVEDLGDSSRQVVDRLAAMIDEAKKARTGVDDLGDDSRKTARKMDDAFDAIAKSSKTAARKVDDSGDGMRESLDDVRDEANSTAREMAASFDGSLDGILDAAQELTANAGQAFGPAGEAIAAAIGIGVGFFFADFKKKQETLQESIDGMTQDLLENQGQLSEGFIKQAVADLGADKLKEIAELAGDANVSVSALIRAYAGDPEAIATVNAQLEANATNLGKVDAAAAANDPTMAKFYEATEKVRGGLGLQTEALDKSKTAYELMREAMGEPVVPKVNGTPAVDEADNTRRRIDKALSRKVNVPVEVQGPSPSELDRINRAIRRGIGTIVVPVKAGQSRFANTADNSRYRE